MGPFNHILEHHSVTTYLLSAAEGRGTPEGFLYQESAVGRAPHNILCNITVILDKSLKSQLLNINAESPRPRGIIFDVVPTKP